MTALLALLSALLAPTLPERLRVEAGILDPAGDAFVIRHPGVRAVVPESIGTSARVDFTYLGPTAQTAPLASGELRRQIGLKLRAQDTCNVVYVMWHVAPTEGVYVQLKSNPGRKTHAECKDHGYRTARTSTERLVPKVRTGERHSLGASLEGRRIRVTADEVLVWDGDLPEEPAFDGPAGIRSDNGEFTATLWTASRRPR